MSDIKVDEYDSSPEAIKRLQARAMAKLKKELSETAAINAKSSLNYVERRVFVAQLFRARLKKHLSQAALAKKLGTRQSAVSRIENGKGNPSLDTLLAIARALDINLVIEYKD